jgi:hypothetical protein
MDKRTNTSEQGNEYWGFKEIYSLASYEKITFSKRTLLLGAGVS